MGTHIHSIATDGGAPSCPRCEYSLSGLPVSGSCPECGLVYDEDFLSIRVRAPRIGWALLAVPPVGYVLSFPILDILGFPLAFVVNLFFIVWMVHVNRRIAVWRRDLRIVQAGRCSKPSKKYHLNLEKVLLGVELLVFFGLWQLVLMLSQ